MSQWTKIDHIGIAVADLEEALGMYSRLGFVAGHKETVPAQKVHTAALSIGESKLELLQPLEENSPVGKFIASKGQGVHHLALQVEDIEAKLRELQLAGFRLIDDKPRIGAGGARVAFLHPQGTLGTLIELVER